MINLNNPFEFTWLFLLCSRWNLRNVKIRHALWIIYVKNQTIRSFKSKGMIWKSFIFLSQFLLITWTHVKVSSLPLQQRRADCPIQQCYLSWPAANPTCLLTQIKVEPWQLIKPEEGDWNGEAMGPNLFARWGPCIQTGVQRNHLVNARNYSLRATTWKCDGG